MICFSGGVVEKDDGLPSSNISGIEISGGVGSKSTPVVSDSSSDASRHIGEAASAPSETAEDDDCYYQQFIAEMKKQQREAAKKREEEIAAAEAAAKPIEPKSAWSSTSI